MRGAGVAGTGVGGLHLGGLGAGFAEALEVGPALQHLDGARELLLDRRAAFLRQIAFSATILAIEIPLGIAVAKGIPRNSRWTAPVLILPLIDLLILDLMMEEVDAGTGMVKELKLLGNQAPIFLLSSVGDNLSMTADYSSMGLAGVFQKPVDRVQLLNVLRMALPEPIATL